MNRIPVWTTVIVAVGAGVMAAVASASVALHLGVVDHAALAALFPVIVEGGAVCCASLAWHRSRLGQRAKPENAMLVALAALSIFVNGAHAWGRSPVTIFLSACPPLILVGMVHLLQRNMRESVARSETASGAQPHVTNEVVSEDARDEVLAPALVPGHAGEPIAVPVGDPQRVQEGRTVPITAPGHSEVAPAPPAPEIVAEEHAHLAEPEPEPVSGGDAVQEGERKRRATPAHKASPKVSAPAKSASKSERLAQIASWVQEGERVTGDLVADRLGVSPATGRRLLAEHRAQEGQAA